MEAPDTITVAVVGCAHGALDTIYKEIRAEENRGKRKLDLLICCGDFECARNEADLAYMEGPAKFRMLKDFHKYYSGAATAPVLTLFVGNHEVTNYLKELYFGGWVAPNIYFLGYSGVVNFCGLKIGGFSGIFDPGDFKKGHYETLPFTDTEKMKISSFHVREFELWKLYQLQNNLDIIISHDWPNVLEYGDKSTLYAQRPSLEGQEFCSKPYNVLLNRLKPQWWFSGHMHVKYEAFIPHDSGGKTHFLALDKALPGREFIEFIEIPVTTKDKFFQHDLEWLAIQKLSLSFFPTQDTPTKIQRKVLTPEELLAEMRLIHSFHDSDSFLDIPHDFQTPTKTHTTKTKQQKKCAKGAPNEIPDSASSSLNRHTEQFLALIQSKEQWEVLDKK